MKRVVMHTYWNIYSYQAGRMKEHTYRRYAEILASKHARQATAQHNIHAYQFIASNEAMMTNDPCAFIQPCDSVR
jgi:hypothetical protein